MTIYCCGCNDDVSARLTDGKEIYPHRKDLAGLPFWVCDTCGNYVGCHHKTKKRIKPLGCIPTPSIRNARKGLHDLIDPIWKSGRIKRTTLYNKISDDIGRRFHTANIKSMDEARKIYRLVESYT